MKIYRSIKRAALIAIALVLEAIDKRITEEQNKPTTAPDLTNSSKYATVRLDTSNEPIRPLQGYRHTPIRPFITTTTLSSKYTPEQLQAFYKINPYTNKPTNPPKKR